MEFTLNIDQAGISSKRKERRSGALLRAPNVGEPILEHGVIKNAIQKPHNKRMQSDQPTRYAPGLATDAERYKSLISSPGHLV